MTIVMLYNTYKIRANTYVRTYYVILCTKNYVLYEIKYVRLLKLCNRHRLTHTNPARRTKLYGVAACK